MAVGEFSIPVLLPIKGIRVGACSAGLYGNNRDDLAAIELAESANCVAVFTRNAFCAAPVVIARQHLEKCTPRYLMINAGNANAGMGDQGYKDAISVCSQLSELTHCSITEILPFSTGVIGERLPLEKITKALPELINNLSNDAWIDVAKAIMTTDTRPKGISRKINLAGHEITITGVVKGSGMIRPDMATMLAFIATDANVEKDTLHEILQYSVEKSFNRISVDGDSSTNDACVLIASGESSLPMIRVGNSKTLELFKKEVSNICIDLAKEIVKDGEGATKFVSVRVQNGESNEECCLVAYSVANSPLVKTALYASDANWGRILAAIGSSGVNNLDINKVSVYLDDFCIVENGKRATEYTEEKGQLVMNKIEFTILINLNRGMEDVTVWTCDLSPEYIRINADYRT